ncbi:hypothetical protein BGZ61DRAFT_548682 [Ilyonectria robusta]|uniref:uncharacterized protein n=1 Tax=Ilyonectria robusta TaxID=1079257 RepID=UPI001E8E00EF|nr:uncharacterized protein BGZ61DRAFT_548682 [Ilyonectria robusta]KAH8684930.1 hypothetical protein BGZ61DRAFT_548682 [Ilyonectria robusta]
MDTSFEDALVKFRASLTDKQKRDFAPCTLKDVETAIEEIQVRLGSQRRLRNMKRISKFIEAMAQLGQVVDVFLNVERTVALIWGPIKFILVAASTWVETLDLLLDTYAEIGEILPGLTQFRNMLGQHPYLKVHLENYYCDVLSFHRNALDVFSRPAWKTVFHSAWKTFKTRFGPILSSLKRHRELISDEKLTIAIREVRDFREHVEEKLEALSRQMTELRLEEKEQETLKLQEQRGRRLQFVLNKFDVLDCHRDLEHALWARRNHNSSGDWIFHHPLLKEWADLKISQSSTLYLSGIPGAGKTILTSKVVEHLKQLKSTNSAHGHNFSVVYFHFNHMQPDKRTLTGSLLALLSQLIHQDDVLLEQTYQRCLAVDQHKIRSLDTIRDLASVAFKSQRVCFVILDGLDECVGGPSANPADEQKQVIDWFEDLTTDIDSNESGNGEFCMRLFISGQRNGILEERLRSYPSIQLETEAAHNRDIESYAKQRSAEMHKRFRFSTEEERDLVNRVTSRAKGMFIYAKIVLSNLLDQVSTYQFKQQLKAENFPKGLDEAYERVVVRAFENPNEPQRLAAKKILGLIICAERSLMWKEIQSTFCIDIDTETADVDRQLSDSCKHLCGSLVEFERSHIAELESDDVVELVHHTARGYLVQSGRLCISRENANMALLCARYLTSFPFTLGLSDSEIEKHAITGYYGFQDYAAAFWWKHAYQVIDIAADIDKDLYNRTLQAVARAMEAYGNTRNSLPEPHESPAHVVKRRLEELGEDSREWENNFNIEFRTRAIRNRIEVLLNEEGASEKHCAIITLYGVVRYKCPKPWCQSFCTGFERREDRDQHLLEHNRPFRCSIEGCYGKEVGFPSESDLSRHTERLHLTQPTIRFASPRLPKGELGGICSAAATGSLAKVKACLLAGIPIDTTTNNKGGQTPLFLAAKGGHIQICQYLLEQGANVNFQGSLGHKRTALHIAAWEDDAELTHLLLSQPKVTPQLKDTHDLTAAGTAAKKGCNNALSAFISRGLASLPGQDFAERTCLSIAIDCGNLKTVELLINDTSLDLNKDYREGVHSGLPLVLPLHLASSRGLVDIAKLLLSSGRVDVNKVDPAGRQALYYALKNRRDSVVKLLLPLIDNRAAIEESGRTLLSHASEKGDTAFCKR